MKKIHPETLARLGAPAATRATCWKVVRRDGAVFGFTDHDRALVFDGITHEPDLGLETGVTTLEPDFASGSAEAAGILSSNAIAEADLAAGLWDGAEVEVHVVDWQDPTHRVLMRRAVIGEVTRAAPPFVRSYAGWPICSTCRRDGSSRIFATRRWETRAAGSIWSRAGSRPV